MDLSRKIEGLLFYKGEPATYTSLSKTLGADRGEIINACTNLQEELKERGIVLVVSEDEVALQTHPDLQKTIETIAKEEFEGPLTKNALETLSIILYHGPLSKPQIDYIRGVNSNFILRNLSVRGLVDKKKDPNDSRTHRYSASLDMLSHLGMKRVEDLPEYVQYREKITRALEENNED